MSRGLVTKQCFSRFTRKLPIELIFFFKLLCQSPVEDVELKEQSKGLVTVNEAMREILDLYSALDVSNMEGQNLIPLCFYFTGDPAGFYGGKQRGLFSFWSLWTACNTSKVKYVICSFEGQKVRENAKFTPYCSGDEYLNNSGAQVLWVGKQM